MDLNNKVSKIEEDLIDIFNMLGGQKELIKINTNSVDVLSSSIKSSLEIAKTTIQKFNNIDIEIKTKDIQINTLNIEIDTLKSEIKICNMLIEDLELRVNGLENN